MPLLALPHQFQVIIYNPLGRKVDWMVRLPVSEHFFDVRDPNGTVVPSDVSPFNKIFSYEYHPHEYLLRCTAPPGISASHLTPSHGNVSLRGYLLP